MTCDKLTNVKTKILIHFHFLGTVLFKSFVVFGIFCIVPVFGKTSPVLKPKYLQIIDDGSVTNHKAHGLACVKVFSYQ